MQDRSSAVAEGGLRVGEAAELLGVSPSTLRLWERRFGLPASGRTRGGHRRYRPEDVDQLRGLRDLVGRGHALGRSSAAAGRSAEDLDLLLATTRAVLRSSSVAEVTNALVAYVHVVGGDVIGASAAGSDALPFDVSFGDGEPLLVVAEEPSVVRLRLEHTLPALVDDARRIVALLRAIDA